MEDKSERAKREEETLKFWQENQVFEKSLEKTDQGRLPAGRQEFVFYDGPPFATGLPHYGSLLSSIAKDVIPRYKTMQGYHVRRRWGWDCHGLPIENMIEKDLDLKSKKEIVEMGEENFCNACSDKVLLYTHEWERYISRIARWVEFDNAYKTMDASYIESVWWALKQFSDKELLYEGRKVLLYCPHCETPVSRAETAMDDSYKDVTESAVTVEFKLKNDPKTSLLAWTTTPWTLPANVGLAVDPEITYVTIALGGRQFVLAKDLLESVFDEGGYEIVKEEKGEALVGLEYEPLYDVEAVKETGKKAWYVMPADFVTTEDGTGIVHTAVIYGEDDYQLGLKHDLPMVPMLDSSGHFNNEAPEIVRNQFFKKANKTVIADLSERGLLFKEEQHTHSYPHCWRCKNALIYNAISAWFLNIQKIKARMQELNKDINWQPPGLRDGRFGKILEGAPDWNISRNRFWASPLPFWKCEECKELKVLGSLAELREASAAARNSYLLMRHGESEANVKKVISANPENSDHLTDKGKGQVVTASKDLSDIDLIVHSDYARTTETAELVASELGLDKSQVVVDERLREIEAGEYEGKSWKEYWDQFKSRKAKWSQKIEGSENFDDVRRRAMEAVFDLEEKYEGKKILIVSHAGVLLALELGMHAREIFEEKYDKKDFRFYDNAAVFDFDFWPFPHNNKYELDLHKPYVDRLELACTCGGQMTRVPEVIDCWVESGSMPFAEYHYPFENKELFESRFPADYIVEYVGQTRTWFYYMLAVATMLFDESSFKNVLVTGNILAGDGQKMSKSLGNYTDPLALFDQYGADAVRYYLMTSPVMLAEDIRFLDDEVKEVNQRMLNLLSNVAKFYETYADNELPLKESDNVLDKWILSRLSQLEGEVRENLDNYNTIKAGRPIRDFITDLSTWYLRRSRDRFKGEGDDKVSAVATTRYALNTLAKLMAPFTPFIAEEVYQATRAESDPLSVHLCDWPEAGKVDEKLLLLMKQTRLLVSRALELRSEAGIKVRQPLGTLKITYLGDPQGEEFQELIRDEVNVKKIKAIQGNKTLSEFGDVELDTNISPELKGEGQLRELVRHVQGKRKEANLSPHDEVSLEIVTDEAGKALVEKFETELKESVGAKSLELKAGEGETGLAGLRVTVKIA